MTEIQEPAGATNPEGGEPAAHVDQTAEIARLRQNQEALQSSNNDLTQKLNQLIDAISAPKEPAMTPERLAQLQQQNPEAALAHQVNTLVKSQVGEATKGIQREANKTRWDDRAAKDFPLINTSPEFQSLVQGKMRELIASDDFKKDSPTLVYRACEAAALRYKPKGKPEPKDETPEPAPAAPAASGRADTTGEPPSAPIPKSVQAKMASDKTFQALSQMFPVKDKQKMWERHQENMKRVGGRR
jgi:hypothetical protein